MGLVEAILQALGTGDLGEELGEVRAIGGLLGGGKEGEEFLFGFGGVGIVPEFVEVGERHDFDCHCSYSWQI